MGPELQGPGQPDLGGAHAVGLRDGEHLGLIMGRARAGPAALAGDREEEPG